MGFGFGVGGGVGGFGIIDTPLSQVLTLFGWASWTDERKKHVFGEIFRPMDSE